jgi:hypothetical protein
MPPGQSGGQLIQTCLQRGKVAFAADEGRPAAINWPSFHRVLLAEQPDRHLRAGEALEGEGLGLAEAEQGGDNLAGLGRDKDVARPGRGLQPLRQMHGVADGCVGQPVVLADGPHDHHAGVDTDADLRSSICSSHANRVELGDEPADGQGGPKRPLGIVLMSHRRPEHA